MKPDLPEGDLQSSETHVRFVEDGKDLTVSMADFRRRFDVDGLVRLNLQDFESIDRDRPFFVHFNLGSTTNEVGQRYAIMPIARAGRRLPGGWEIIPTLNPTRRLVGVCVEVRRRVPLHHVTVRDFSHSLSNVRSVNALRSALLLRYGKLYPENNLNDILGQGCSITRFAFV